MIKQAWRQIAARGSIWLLLLSAAPQAPAQQITDDNFTFVRIRYSMGYLGYAFQSRYGAYDSWMVDFPSAEENFLRGFAKATSVPVSGRSVSIGLTEDALFDYAFAYVVEVGYMQLTDEEAKALREWLLRGGFLLIDDFHGWREWQNFVYQFKKVFPEREPRDIPIDHPIFHCYYDFDYFPQVPGLAALYRGVTYEKGGKVPHCRGIFDDQGRLMVLINHNMDLGDSWEHAADRRYQIKYSILGYKLGINYIIYALTH
ncbi:MAG: DUF4159 domain-containing protein [candidate division KSB1 bacterium]|nr:DUF4159 domain-containing protein [candidate division KSB1 bacterium]